MWVSELTRQVNQRDTDLVTNWRSCAGRGGTYVNVDYPEWGKVMRAAARRDPNLIELPTFVSKQNYCL